MKYWYQSKTVIGGLVAMISGIAGVFGVVVDEQSQEQITELVVSTTSLVGGALAVYGRIKANTQVKF